MYKNTILVLFCLSMIGLSNNAISAVYNFDSLSPGALNGQDNWVVTSSGGQSEVFAGSHDSTLYISRTGPGAGNTRAIGTRVNDGNFSLSFIQGGSLDIDMRLNHWGNSFGFGFDADTNGFLETGERTLTFIAGNVPGINLNGTSINANAIGMSSGDWVSFHIDFDFDANGGAGRAYVSAKNITDGDVVFSAIVGLQGVNLGLPTTGNQTFDNWNAMWFRFEADTNASIDNISFRAPVLVPLLTPTSLILLALSIMFFGWRFVARKMNIK